MKKYICTVKKRDTQSMENTRTIEGRDTVRGDMYTVEGKYTHS